MASIFHKVGKRLLDPYSKREIVLLLNKPANRVDPPKNTESDSKFEDKNSDPLDEPLPELETSPLDLFVEQFQRDLSLQDNVQFVDRIPEPIKPAKPKLVTPKKAAAKPNKLHAEAPALPVIVAVPDPPAEPWSHEKFWRWASGLGWADRSDGHSPQMATYLLSQLTKNERAEMLKVYRQLFDTMKETLSRFLAGYDMNESNRDILVSHVIAKGEEFYMAAAADPDFLGYLISDANAPAKHNDFVDFHGLVLGL